MIIKLMLFAAIGMVSLGRTNAEECCSGSINYNTTGCTCGSKTCKVGQACSDGKCLYEKACPDGKPYFTDGLAGCGCGGRDSDTACTRLEVCTASTKTCGPPEPPACKATFAALTGLDQCKCGDITCRSGTVACDPTKDTGAQEGKGECSYPTCPSSGAATNTCSCVKDTQEDWCYEGQTCTDGVCAYPACKVGEKTMAERCSCGTDVYSPNCAIGEICSLQDGNGKCEYPKCSGTVTETCMCGNSRCSPGMTCSADDAKKNQCGCTPSKDLVCTSMWDNDVAAGTCPNTCVGKKVMGGGGPPGKCEPYIGGSYAKRICLEGGKSFATLQYDNKDCSGDPYQQTTTEGCLGGVFSVACVYDEEKAAAAGLGLLKGGAVSALKGQLGAVAAFAAMATAFVVAL